LPARRIIGGKKLRQKYRLSIPPDIELGAFGLRCDKLATRFSDHANFVDYSGRGLALNPRPNMSSNTQSGPSASAVATHLVRYNRFLLLVAGLGGLLYGIDVGIIGGALPYLEATSHLTPAELSIVVAAVLLGSVFSTLFAGLLADWMGRKPLMILSGAAFTVSIPIIALSQSYSSLFAGRLLQGMSGGIVGVVVPLYLAECLSADKRGRGTGVFQWLLTLGIFVAALIGVYFSYHVAAIEKTASAVTLFHAKDRAWRSIFWVSMPPGLLFVLGSFFVSESPRWLFRGGRSEAAHAALLRSRTPDQAGLELGEMQQIAAAAEEKRRSAIRDSLFQRRYVLPFLLACVILSCNTATGINSLVGFNTNITIQSGLTDVMAHWGYVLFTFLNFLFTIVGMTLVDRKGRKFLFLVGTSGIVVSMIAAGTLFHRTESDRTDIRGFIQSRVSSNQSLNLQAGDLASATGAARPGIPMSFSIIYSYGAFTSATMPVRTDSTENSAVTISRDKSIPSTEVEAFFRDPFADLGAARSAPLRIEHAYLETIPSTLNGWLMALCLYVFVAFYAMGPGVCVWLALSELMPTRIRSNGMSIALVLNQLVSTTLAAIFLPVVGKYGYSTMFFLFAGFTVIYLVTVALFLPETKGKTLEEIEKHFEAA
jgi:MFS transporter, SP family, solute carrier family 2 (myo-inositol transporter), member 13